jgi:signal transduction histidine kinase
MSLLRGLPRLQLLGFIAPLALVVVFAAVLAFSTLEANRSHRASVLRTVEDYADFAAFILSNVMNQELERRLSYAFFPLNRYDPASSDSLPSPSVLGQDRIESSRCAATGDTLPTYARLNLKTGDLVVSGTRLSAHAERWMADTLRAEAKTWKAGGSFAHIFGGQDRPALLAYRVIPDSAGQALAVYAKSSCLVLATGRSLFALAMESAPLLPPFLTGGLPNDSILSVKVIDPHGQTLWATPIQYPSTAVGEWEGGTRFGGLRLQVSLKPEIANHLVIGGLPAARLPMAALLLMLTIVFTGLAILQLRQQQKLMRLRERFLGNVSHELRTPLQQILLFTELQRMDKLRTDEERQHSLEVVERETRRLMQLVDNVLQFSKASRGEDPLVLQPLELEPVIRETVQTFLPLARMNDVSIKLELNPTRLVLADAQAVRRILVNLLDNAVKYGPRGQTVTVGVRSEDGVTLTVEDQGPGIPPLERQRVFEPFQRLEREETAARSGSGMGLAIVRDLAIRMGGRVRIEDTGNAGVRFVVQFSPENS